MAFFPLWPSSPVFRYLHFVVFFHQELTVLYSELKKKYPDDSAGEARSRGRAHEDDEENYENIPRVLLASDH